MWTFLRKELAKPLVLIYESIGFEAAGFVQEYWAIETVRELEKKIN